LPVNCIYQSTQYHKDGTNKSRKKEILSILIQREIDRRDKVTVRM
jgi:hypothetical protein